MLYYLQFIVFLLLQISTGESSSNNNINVEFVGNRPKLFGKSEQRQTNHVEGISNRFLAFEIDYTRTNARTIVIPLPGTPDKNLVVSLPPQGSPHKLLVIPLDLIWKKTSDSLVDDNLQSNVKTPVASSSRSARQIPTMPQTGKSWGKSVVLRIDGPANSGKLILLPLRDMPDKLLAISLPPSALSTKLLVIPQDIASMLIPYSGISDVSNDPSDVIAKEFEADHPGKEANDPLTEYLDKPHIDDALNDLHQEASSDYSSGTPIMPSSHSSPEKPFVMKIEGTPNVGQLILLPLRDMPDKLLAISVPPTTSSIRLLVIPHDVASKLILYSGKRDLKKDRSDVIAKVFEKKDHGKEADNLLTEDLDELTTVGSSSEFLGSTSALDSITEEISKGIKNSASEQTHHYSKNENQDQTNNKRSRIKRQYRPKSQHSSDPKNVKTLNPRIIHSTLKLTTYSPQHIHNEPTIKGMQITTKNNMHSKLDAFCLKRGKTCETCTFDHKCAFNPHTLECRSFWHGIKSHSKDTRPSPYLLVCQVKSRVGFYMLLIFVIILLVIFAIWLSLKCLKWRLSKYVEKLPPDDDSDLALVVAPVEHTKQVRVKKSIKRKTLDQFADEFDKMYLTRKSNKS